ncbi:MAG: hypothetical protein U1E36_09055 [Rickettsiales bacterium]
MHPAPARPSNGEYTYAPTEQENYATITGSPIHSMVLNSAAGSAYITHIDGQLVPYIDDGGFQWMLYGSNMRGITFPLTAGSHVITYELRSGNTASFDMMFYATGGEDYVLKAVNELGENQKPVFHVWIEDTKAHMVTPEQVFDVR